jgi:hypothetical protein
MIGRIFIKQISVGSYYFQIKKQRKPVSFKTVEVATTLADCGGKITAAFIVKWLLQN